MAVAVIFSPTSKASAIAAMVGAAVEVALSCAIAVVANRLVAASRSKSLLSSSLHSSIVG